MDHPTYTLDQIIQQLTTSWPGGSDTNTRTWHAAGHQLEIDGPWGYPTARLGYGDEITYSLGVAPYIPPTAPDSMVAESRASLPGVVKMSAVQIASAQLAFQLWDDLVPFSIVQNSGSNADAADITLNYSSTTPSDRTTTDQFRAQPSNSDEGLGNAYIWLASDWPALSNDGMVNGGYGLVSMEHEIGHALGLSHPGTYNIAVGGFDSTATYATDNRQYTIMSYFGYYSNNAPDTLDGWTEDGTQYGSDGGTAGGTLLYPQTPMVDDIAAIQSLYGADYGTRSGDTVYGFNCNITGYESWIYDFNKNPTPIFSIWDGGGNDTLDCSGYTGPQIINLTPGSYSSVDGLVNNIGIAYGTDIENAVGGSGDDTFIVSYAYGDFHTLNGGSGIDTVVFSSFNKNILVDLSGNYSAVLEADGWHDLANLVSIENVVGGAGDDEIWGDDGANRIRAGAGIDTIHGGGGKDTLLAGLGVDTIYGDDGDDTLVEMYKYNPFAFDYLDGGTGTNTVNFSNYQDALRIDLSAGTASTTDSADLTSGTQRKVATLVSIQNVYGGAGNDEITGDDEDNRIFAGAGNDTIHGGGGKDTLLAGLGVDTIYGDGGDDTLVETYKYNPFAFDYLDGGSDTNTVDFSSYQDAVRIDLSAGKAWTTDSADLSSGTLRQVAALVSIENAIGGAGNDVLTGDSNNNTIDGGAGINTAVFHGPRSDYTITSLADGDLQVADSVAGRDGTDLLKNIQNLQFSDGDILYGTPGADTLQGTSGDDTLIGEAGDDILTGGLGKDTFVFGDNWGVDTITDFEVGSDVLDMIAVSGLTSFSQLMIENIYFPNGATGVVIMFGDNRIIIPNIDSSQVTPAMFKFAAPVTVLAESADLNVAYADASTATSGLHYALAGTGVQMVFGSAGNDVLDASGTNDYHTMLYGGAGNDTLIAGSGGSYTLQGGPGDDTAVFSGNQSDYTIDGSPAGWPSWATVTDNATGAVNWLQSVEHLQFADGTIDTPGLPPGGDFTNVLFLDSSNPPANIGPGYDTVYVDDSHGPNPVHLNLAGTDVTFAYGGLGSDVFDASGATSGVDLWGQWGNDVLIGGSGNDTLVGDEWLPGGGNDWLDGGAGNDWLAGGNGDDTFVFRPGSGMDTVEDFDQAYPSPTSSTMVHTDDHDVIRFEDGLFANFDALVASGDMTQSGTDVVIKYGATDQVTMLNVSLSQLGANDFVFDAGTASPPMPPGKTFDGTASWGGTLTGTAGNDTASFANATGAVYVDLKSGTAQLLDGSGTIEHLVSIENVTGSSNYQNGLIGDQNDNVLMGGNGLNWFDGGGGNNTLIGGSGTQDYADYLNMSPNPVTIDLPNGKVYHGNGVDTVSGIEEFRGTTGADTFIGDGADNYFLGMDGNDTMYGNGGNDWLEASGGNSTIDGGPGNDKIVSGVGNDVLTGGADADTFVFRGNAPGDDRITDFNAAEGDRIDFSQNAFVKQMSDIRVTDDGNGNAVLSYGTTGGPSSIVLTGVAPTAVSAGWFIFDTDPNTAPAFSGVAQTATFTAGKPVTLSPSITVADPDNLYLASATVTVSAGTFGNDGDVLSANTAGTNITASYDSATEALMLTGSDVSSHYQQVLDSITFTSTSPNPTHYGLNPTRTISWVVNDGRTSNNVSALASTTVNIIATPPVDTAPVVKVSNIAAQHGQSFAAASLFKATDADGDAITQYAFRDSGTGGGHFVLNGVVQPVNQEIDVTAAQLSQLSYQSGSGADTLQVRASDGLKWSSWSNSFTVSAPIDPGPTVTPTDASLKSLADQTFAASSLIGYSDPFGSPATQYDFWNSGGGGGHFVLNGAVLPAKQDNIISAAQLGQLSYQVGTGTDTLRVKANDGTVWGSWSKNFTISDPPTIAAHQTLTLGSAYAGTVDFASDTGTLKLEDSSSFAGTVAGLHGRDMIDLADIGFNASSTLAYAGNPDHSGGTLSVGDGMHMANIALLGSYMASTFAAASDGHGGTLISETAHSAVQQTPLSLPHV